MADISFYLEHIPDLEDLLKQYLEHDDILTSSMASPQKKSENYDPTEEQTFLFTVEDANIKNDEEVIFSMTKSGVHVLHKFDGEYCEEHQMTHEKCLAYLKQLPRSWYSFTTKEEN